MLKVPTSFFFPRKHCLFPESESNKIESYGLYKVGRREVEKLSSLFNKDQKQHMFVEDSQV